MIYVNIFVFPKSAKGPIFTHKFGTVRADFTFHDLFLLCGATAASLQIFKKLLDDFGTNRV